MVARLVADPGGLVLSLEPLVTATDGQVVWRQSTDLTTWAPAAPDATREQAASRPEAVRRESGFNTSGGQRFLSPGAR